MSDELKTWTFEGHWENGRIIVTDVREGRYQDLRIDTGYWEEGLFAAAAEGRTEEEAEAAMRAEYEDEEDRCEGHPAGPFDPMGETTYCDGSCA
jgi:hypothetical protein